jgi:hypothetical protein
MASDPSDPVRSRLLARICERAYMETLTEIYLSGDFECEPGCPYPGRRGFLALAAELIRRAADLREAGVPTDAIAGLVEACEGTELRSLGLRGRALRVALRAIRTGRVVWRHADEDRYGERPW